MALAAKGMDLDIGSVEKLTVTLKWTVAADFDLVALYESREGETGLVYFGDFGELDAFPFMQLSGDEGSEEETGDHQESLEIVRMDEMKYIRILCWDYGKLQKGDAAGFNESDLSLVITDDKGRTHDVCMDCPDSGNVMLFATIDNASFTGAKLINNSKAGMLKGLSSIEQLMGIIRS